jgi:hypothetical protein
VGLHTVHAQGQNFSAQFLKRRIFDGDRRQLRRSNGSEIPQIKEEQNPAAAIIAEMHAVLLSPTVGVGRKIRGLFPDFNLHISSLRAIGLRADADRKAIINLENGTGHSA